MLNNPVIISLDSITIYVETLSDSRLFPKHFCHVAEKSFTRLAFFDVQQPQLGSRQPSRIAAMTAGARTDKL